MIVLFVSKLPIDLGGRPPYAQFLVHGEGGELRDAIPCDPVDDVEALVAIKAKWTGARLTCSLELAAAGAPLGYVPCETPDGVARHRAAAALLAVQRLHVDMSAADALELASACALFLESAIWKERDHSSATRYAARASLSGEGTTGTMSLVLRVTETADGPGLELRDQGDFERMVYAGRAAPHAMRPLRLALTLASSPRFVADAMAEAFGMPFVPRISLMLEGSGGPHGDLEALLLAAALRAVAATPRAKKTSGEARLGAMVVRVEVDRTRSLPYEAPKAGSRLANRELARTVANALYAAAPNEVDLQDMFCLVLDPREGLARMISEVLHAHSGWGSGGAPGGPKKKGTEWRGVWLPRGALEPLAEYIGPTNLARLREYVPPYAARVLIIVANVSDTIEIDIEPGEAARLRSELEELDAARRVLPELERAAELRRSAAPSAEAPAVVGTWRDGRAYLPKEPMADWRVQEPDARGVVTVEVGGALTFQVGPQRRDGKRFVGVMIWRADASKPTREEVEGVLQHLRGCKRFTEMQALRNGQPLPMPGIRIFMAPLTGDGVS